MHQPEVGGANGKLQVVQVSLGFDRSHPKVWQYLREQNLLVIPVSRAPLRLKPLHVGQRVVIYFPKSQGGFGIVGIGMLTGEATTFEKAGKFLNDPIGSSFRAHMRNIYTDDSNRPLKGKSCFNKQFKCHRDRLEKCEVEATPWDYGLRWRSDTEWLRKRQNPHGYYVHYPVKWEATVPFEDGFLHVDWNALGLSSITLSSLSSLVPRYFTQPHLDALISRLRQGSSDVLSTSTRPNLAPVAHQSSSLRTVRLRKRPAASASVVQGCAKKSRSSCSDSRHKVEELLVSLGLQEYILQFQKEKVDIDALQLLTDDDLISLGLPLGPRRKIQAAVQNIK
eukprot:TRINITY_DN637_c0_g1_i1.p1 TRINITY_DN637_c0_g1~~TRINITY_DN637_c0_g1_i1.p1  ORF type:complete len:337 (-),score=39.94 TRINITY_DN637_c0_g1_i1:109-1119(-)